MPNLYDVGDEVRVTGTFTDADGNVQDPTALTFKFTDPSGNTVTYTYGTDAELVKSGTGVYYVDIDIDESGTWWFRFAATGAGRAADEAYFLVEESRF